MLLSIKLSTLVLLIFVLTPVMAAKKNSNKTFFTVERTIQTDSDVDITSIGAWGLEGNKVGHFNLSYIESKSDPDDLGLDFGAAGAYTGGATIYLGLGFLVRFNKNTKDFTAALYPELGAAFIIKEKYGLNVTAKRYYNFYGRTENVVLLSLMFGI